MNENVITNLLDARVNKDGDLEVPRFDGHLV
jgi:hypothetical protein